MRRRPKTFFSKAIVLLKANKSISISGSLRLTSSVVAKTVGHREVLKRLMGTAELSLVPTPWTWTPCLAITHTHPTIANLISLIGQPSRHASTASQLEP